MCTSTLVNGISLFAGVQSYLDRYADMVYGVASASGPPVRLHNDPAMTTVFDQLEKLVPIADLPARRAWRDNGVARLNKLRRDMDDNKGQ